MYFTTCFRSERNMVFFTCNACGSSLKKNQVEKHYQSECPRCEVLSCMDCGRDFHGDEYTAHTKCISEAEKYQGGLFKESGKAGGAGKGEKKQQEWLERVQGLVANGTKVNPRITRLLERISQYPNIPRKRAKFENFVKNSINVRDPKTLGELWDIFSTAIKPPTSENASGDGKIAADEAKEQKEPDEIANTEEPPPQPKKEKKRKKSKVEESAAPDTCDTPDVDSKPTEIKKKKKKRHKDMEEVAEVESAEVEENNSASSAPEEVTVSCETKKKKKRKHGENDETASVAETHETLPINGDLEPSKKKKKSKEQNIEDTETGDNVVGVEPMDVALEYINGHTAAREDISTYNCSQNDAVVDDCDLGAAGSKPKKSKKKKRKNERGTGMEEEEMRTGEITAPKKRKKHQRKSEF